MTEKIKNNIAAGLLIMNFELKGREYIATNDRDFNELSKIANVQTAIETVLSELESIN
ncbi:MAG: hypothetical protein KBS82_05475 [Oscillospiraceae bacterium]|nr:hypothetical protein [Candidatus Limimonas egerieequi]